MGNTSYNYQTQNINIYGERNDGVLYILYINVIKYTGNEIFNELINNNKFKNVRRVEIKCENIIGINYLISLLTEFKFMTSLKIRSKFKLLPNNLFGFNKLELLDVSNCELESIDGIDKFISLKQLDISKNNLENISDIIKVKQLREICFAENNLTVDNTETLNLIILNGTKIISRYEGLSNSERYW